MVGQEESEEEAGPQVTPGLFACIAVAAWVFSAIIVYREPSEYKDVRALQSLFLSCSTGVMVFAILNLLRFASQVAA